MGDSPVVVTGELSYGPPPGGLYTAAVAQRLPEATKDGAPPADEPPIDPEAVRDAYRLHRARRKARIAHRRRTRRAGIRFWLVLLALLVASVVVAVTIWHEIQQLFGL